MILPRQGEGNDLAPYKNSQVFAKHLEVEAGFVEGGHLAGRAFY
jgi:hypothetical protein